MTLQDFQRLAGYDDTEDYTQTILVSEGSQTVCLKAWLDQQAAAVAPRSGGGHHRQRQAARGSTNSFQSDFSAPPVRSIGVPAPPPSRHTRERTAQSPPSPSLSARSSCSSSVCGVGGCLPWGWKTNE